MSVRDDEFVAFVEAYRPRLERTARLLTAGDEGGAEDLVQITLTKDYVNWRTVAGVDSPIAYAHRILSNAAIDKRRSAFSRRELRSAEPREFAPVTTGVDGAVTDRHVRSALKACRTGARNAHPGAGFWVASRRASPHHRCRGSAVI